MSKTRRFSVSALIVLTFLLSLCPTILARPPPPGYIDAGYKLGGAWTPYDLDGIRARIEVTDPEVPHKGGSGEFFAAWIMVIDDAGLNWMSVGWAEKAHWGDEHLQMIYVEYVDLDAQPPVKEQIWYGYDYPIEAGDWIWVKLTHSGYSWTARLYWNGAWRVLLTRTMPFSKAPETEQMGELYIEPDQYGKGYVWPFPDTHFNDVYIYMGRRTYRWYYGLITTYAVADRPIYPWWINRYYYWYVYYTG